MSVKYALLRITSLFATAKARANWMPSATKSLTILKKLGERPIYHEGEASSGWMLVDYGNVIVTIFSLEQRAFYQLDELWNQANSRPQNSVV